MSVTKSEAWFREVFNSQYDPLRNYLYYLSGDIHWSEDTVQEVFLMLWRKREEIKDETLTPYLFKTGRNFFLKEKRHENVRLRFLKEARLEDREEAMPSYSEKDDFDRMLESAISALPEKCRSVFLMSRMDGMKNQKISENLGISLKAVEKHITRALKELRTKLEGKS